MIDVEHDGLGIDAVFPSVADIFVNPHFRLAPATRSARLADETWWAEHTGRRTDLELVLARHFSTGNATQLPLLVLGHPGAGKSLLVKVLAARLPDSGYTVVRVPLRRVDADATVSEQIHQALEQLTHGRVAWPDLVEQSADVVRVVLLDGLDELLQATTNDRGGYLADIAEFQRVEAALGRPVAVVVTSRTLVVDRVRVRPGTPVLKLDEFDEDQVRQWVRIWNEANRDTGVRPMTVEAALGQDDLAHQPLLLLMLTLYFVDPNTAVADSDLSRAELYRLLFDTYARREVTKQTGRDLSPAEFEEAVRAQLTRLSAAALGTFNRGRQSISEDELTADLIGLREPVQVGRRVLGEFFFVHAAEALTGSLHRSYEFLHATFVEYLVAARVLDVLVEVAEGSFGRRRFHEPDDGLLFALLSHQPLAIQRPTLDFLDELLGQLAEDERTDVLRVLDLLIAAHRDRHAVNRYPDYRPSTPDTVRALAAYSANLVLLRALATPDGPVPVSAFWPADTAATQWSALVSLWQAGLDTEGFRAMFGALRYDAGEVSLEAPFGTPYAALRTSRLKGDVEAEQQLQVGIAVIEDSHIPLPANWPYFIVGLLRSVGHGRSVLPDHHDLPPASVPDRFVRMVAAEAYGVLATRCVGWDSGTTRRYLEWLLRLPAPARPSHLPLSLAFFVHPSLPRDLEASPLRDTWHPSWELAMTMATTFRGFDLSTVVTYLQSVGREMPRVDFRALRATTDDRAEG